MWGSIMPEPIPFIRPDARMSEADYETERAELRKIYGETSGQAGAKREQALALLFKRSGWTQEQLAKKEGKSQSQIQRALLFGEFLNITPNGVIPETIRNSLNEGKFRGFWEQTDKLDGNRDDRFAEVTRLINDAVASRQRKPPLVKPILERFADGEWHALSTVTAHVADPSMGIDEDHVRDVLQNLKDQAGTRVRVEKKKYGKTFQYRMFRIAGQQTVGVEEIRTKLGPILKRLEAESKKNMATMDIGAVKLIFFDLKNLVDGWTA